MKLTGFHIEPTNRCVLGCSACERTQFIQKFGQKNWHSQDLDLDALIKFMDIDVTGLQWGLCGNTGDPVYYDKLAELMAWIKSQQGRIVLTTNGSYRSESWWNRTLEHLTSDDIVEFSVDGLPDTSPIYRTNSDWSSIDVGMQAACQSHAQVVWKMVPFAFNEHEIQAVRDLAQSRGMTLKIDRSNRFSDSDPLKPTEQTMIWHRGGQAVDPMCAAGDQHYISASGQYSPCCYMAHHVYYYKSQFHLDADNYNISKTTISQVLEKINNFDEHMQIDPQPVCSYTCRTL
jgi:organic radical activating enzyme